MRSHLRNGLYMVAHTSSAIRRGLDVANPNEVQAVLQEGFSRFD